MCKHLKRSAIYQHGCCLKRTLLTSAIAIDTGHKTQGAWGGASTGAKVAATHTVQFDFHHDSFVVCRNLRHAHDPIINAWDTTPTDRRADARHAHASPKAGMVWYAMLCYV